MKEVDWHSGSIADLLLHTLDVHRAVHGAEQEDSAVLQGPHSAFRGDLARKHMLLAYGIVRHYWLELDPQVQSAVEALESFENTPTIAPEPPLDDFGYVMDLFLDASNQGTADSEISIAMWLVAGWWPEVKSTWSGIDLPESWRPLIQDIFGNPFRPVAFDPAWRTSTAIALVQQMYDSRDFNLMPILGDALQDAGCVSADILDHCRGDGPHVRGCWVVDLVLGKT